MASVKNANSKRILMCHSLNSQYELSFAINNQVGILSTKVPTYDIITYLFMFATLRPSPLTFAHWYISTIN